MLDQTAQAQGHINSIISNMAQLSGVFEILISVLS